MRCESCRSGDPVCNSWEPCDRQAVVIGADTFPLQRTVSSALNPEAGGCRRCGGPVFLSIGIDEEDERGVVRAVAECRVCGWSR